MAAHPSLGPAQGEIVAETLYLTFSNLRHPIALVDAAPLKALIDQTFACWPYVVSEQTSEMPFLTIRPGGTDSWSLENSDNLGATRLWDDVNALCDVIAEIAWERLRSDPSLLCLHAAALNFSGRLVLFPNERRAGKSTLTAALTRLGHQVYSDDFLPLMNAANTGCVEGIANGIAPRIRLPLPNTFSDEMHQWVSDDTGPSNKQYKYLCGAHLAANGDTMPLGAIIVLNRKDSFGMPTLTPMDQSDALSQLITHNFARVQRSDLILKKLEELTQSLPVLRLTYACGEQAAGFLSSHPMLQSLPTSYSTSSVQIFAEASLKTFHEPSPAFVATQPYVQASGVFERLVGDEHYLTDQQGCSIFRLNSGAIAIWNVLQEPTNLNEIVEVFSVAFPDIDDFRIQRDVEAVMRELLASRLIISGK